MISDTFYKDQSDIVESIIEIDNQIKEENAKEKRKRVHMKTHSKRLIK